MNPDIKVRWVEALRSGRYEQARGVLRKQIDDQGRVGYCCLGVLCDLYVGLGVGHWGVSNYDGSVSFRTEGGSASIYPPAEAAVHAGLDNHDMQDLAFMNDEGATFAEIANKIESEL